MLPDGHAADHNSSRSERRPASNDRTSKLLRRSSDVCAGAHIVGEGHAWAQEDIILDCHPVPKQNRVLNGYPVTESRAAFNVSVIADIAIRSDHGALQHVSKCPDPRARPHVVAFAERRGVHLW
jgi:hypothetical protein